MYKSNLSEYSANVPISPLHVQPIMLYLITQSQPSVTIALSFSGVLLQQVPHGAFPSSQLPRGLRAAVTLRSAMVELKMTLPLTATTWHHSIQTEKSRRMRKDREQQSLQRMTNTKRGRNVLEMNLDTKRSVKTINSPTFRKLNQSQWAKIKICNAAGSH